jgi:alpha-glucosidase (family GH31 glycosyl hydrolase)
MVAGWLCLLALPGAAAAQGRVDAGALRAEVQADPWRVTFADPGGATVLAEAPGRGRGDTGALGFRTAAGWARATRVLAARAEGGAYVASVATTDPAGRRLDVRIAPAGDGVITLQAAVAGATAADVSAVAMAFEARPGERYLGFGERSNAVDQRGGTVENRVADGPYQPEERPGIAAIVPPAGFSDRDDATYFPMPWLLSTAGYGVLVDNDETSRHRLGSDDAGAWSVEADGTALRLRVFAGPAPADVLRRLTEHTGRQPPPGAPWFFGPWFQPRGDVGRQVAEARALRAADAPASVAQTYTHYLPCGAQRGQQERERRRTRELHAAGFAVTTYFNPMICTGYAPVYDRAASAGLLTRDAAGRPVTYRYGASADADDQFLVGQVDFSVPAGRAFYGELLGEAVADGYDGWMEDFGEYTPPDSRSGDGSTGATMHNRYPVLYHRASAEFALARRRPAAAGFIRSGWTGVHPYAQLVWGGDPSTDWGFDGLASAVRQGLTMGLSGISRWGSDVGGFFALGPRRLTPELLVRWIELGAVSGIMRTQANGVALPPQADRPQIADPAILPVWRRYAKLRTQLYPYLRAADAEYRRTGLPLMRHMALVHPGDATARERDDQFFVGPDLLAAPVLHPGERERRLYLPPGRWVPFEASIRPDGRDGGLKLGRAEPLRGEREVTLPAPLESLPLLVRAGSVLPLLPADVDTLADGDGGDGTVSLADRARTLRLLALPRGRTMARFGERGRIDSIERRWRWRLKLQGAARRRIGLAASLRTLDRPFRPCAVRLDGRRLRRAAWRYDRRTGVLRTSFRARRRVARLVVTARRCGGR